MNIPLILHNPIWLRDLRLIVRLPTFFLPFLGQHLFFAFLLGGQFLMPADAQAAGSIDTLLWTVASLYTLVVIPLTALNSISDELHEGRGELVLLTRLTASAIAYGKWLAHATLSLLFLCSNLPYFVLRLYFGRYELWTDLILLGLLWAGSLLLSAIAVCLSAYLSRSLKLLFFLVFILLGLISGFDAMRGRFVYDLPLHHHLADLLLVLVLLLAPFAVLMIEFAVLRLRSAVEKHYSPIRYLGLYLMWALTAAHAWTTHHELLLLLGSLLGAILVLASWSQPCLFLPWLYRPFLRFGLFGRWAGRLFFYPGWPTGLFYTWLVLCPLLVSFSQSWSEEKVPVLIAAMAIWLIVLLPTGISLFFEEKYPQCRSMKFYTIVQMVGFASMAILGGISYSHKGLEFLVLIPWVGLSHVLAKVSTAQFFMLVAYPLLFLLLWISLYLKRASLAPRIQACETAALAELALPQT